MRKPPAVDQLSGLASRLAAFAIERYPFALQTVLDAYEAASAGGEPRGESSIEALRPGLTRELKARLEVSDLPDGIPDPTPRTAPIARMQQASAELIEACDGFLRRQAIESSLTPGERREMLRGMVLTRAVDNRLKTFFTSSEIRYGST